MAVWKTHAVLPAPVQFFMNSIFMICPQCCIRGGRCLLCSGRNSTPSKYLLDFWIQPTWAGSWRGEMNLQLPAVHRKLPEISSPPHAGLISDWTTCYTWQVLWTKLELHHHLLKHCKQRYNGTLEIVTWADGLLHLCSRSLLYKLHRAQFLY